MNALLKILCLVVISMPLTFVAYAKGNLYSPSPSYTSKDSLIKAPTDTLWTKKRKRKTKSKPPKKVDNFYKNVKEGLYKTRFTKWIYKALFRDNTKSDSKSEEAEFINPYLPYENKVIRNIRLKKLDIFGTSIHDTTKMPKKWYQKTANKLHIKTANWVIRQNLLFNKGYLLSPDDIYQNERLLRQLRFIRDARIHVIQKDTAGHAVDVLVITKDVYPISFDFSPEDINAAKLSVDHRNLFGFGHEMDNSFEYDEDDDEYFGYEGIYRIPNIKGAFITGELEYANTQARDALGARVFRNFITPDIRYAGGIEVSRQRLNFIRESTSPDTTLIFPYEFDTQSAWIARAYRSFLHPPAEQIKEKLRIVIGAKISNLYHLQRPVTRIDTNLFFQNNLLLLTKVGLSSREYVKDRLIFGVGRTEDVPVGYKAELTIGHQLGEFIDRFYSGITIGKGEYLKQLGYFNYSISAGGFLNGVRFEEGVAKANLFFFSNLFNTNHTKLRQFVRGNYTVGIRRLPDEFIDIRDRNGVRGLKSQQLRGTSRLALNTETVAFTKAYFMGFRLAIFGFVDFGWITDDAGSLFSGNTYQGYGIGFRFRNDNLAFNTFQIRLGYYPVTPSDAEQLDFNFSSLPRLRVNDFDITEPAILKFN